MSVLPLEENILSAAHTGFCNSPPSVLDFLGQEFSACRGVNGKHLFFCGEVRAKKMGRVNIWLKRSYMGVTALIVVICILLLGFTVFNHGVMHTREKAENEIVGLHFLYIFSAVILLFTVFGVFGVWKQKKWALIVFAVGMILGSLLLLFLIINALTATTQMENEMKKELDFLPLDNASDSALTVLKHIQKEFECCGLKSYKDWKNNIPESCLCNEPSTNPCLLVRDSEQLRPIYAKPCPPIIIASLSYAIQVIMGIMWGLILLWVFSVGLCVAILCQMNKKLETPNVAYSSEAKAGNYTTLMEDPVAV
ncbi:tetraspanin-8 [Austrofundulus limnaeus]|uniref:Tetraspanin-8 n=1 Tax=Austrofundulus limnaeus TaxID=52670 RepID=A0A2I4BXH0_AUSLI|nr:PREDICTED: tetraspanin-8-like [Austrofundulus limnaeus]